MRISDDGLTLLEVDNLDINYNGTFIIPESVTTIGFAAFNGYTSLTNITIPESVKWIGPYAFRLCMSLNNITIPNSVTHIGRGAFEFCTSLTSITIPASVTDIDGLAFRFCTNLTNIVIASEDDEVIARIKALLPCLLQDNVAPKTAYIKAKLIQDNALAVIECAAISSELASAIPTDALHLLVAGYAGGEHVVDQVKKAMQSVQIPGNDSEESWATYSDSVNACEAQVKAEAQAQAQAEEQAHQLRIAQFTAAHPYLTFAIQNPGLTSGVAGLLVAVVAAIAFAPLVATSAAVAVVVTASALASTATFFAIPVSLSAHIASQNKADEQDELGANVAPV